MNKELKWTNPKEIDLSKNIGMIYYVEVFDKNQNKYQYIGKTKKGKSRFNQYKNNIKKIFEGKPRRPTEGQEKYRAVHLALAKACEHNLDYAFFPIENVSIEELSVSEQKWINKLSCNLNNQPSWQIESYKDKSLLDYL